MQVSDAGLKVVGRMKKLKYFEITNGDRITREGVRHLVGLPALSVLGLELSGVDDDALRHVAAARELKELYLFGTFISDQGLAHLSGMAKLTKIRLRNTVMLVATAADGAN